MHIKSKTINYCIKIPGYQKSPNDFDNLRSSMKTVRDISSQISNQGSFLIKVHTPTLYSGCLGLVSDEGRDKLR